MKEIRLMSPGAGGHIINEYGLPEKPPHDWAFLPAGDAALTRKVTAAGACWRIQIKKGRRLQSLGIWAPKDHIALAKQEVDNMRSAPDYARKMASAAKSRDKKQSAYTTEFEQAVIGYLNFHPIHRVYETTMARLITAHATPVGSGTVARTQRIPLTERAARAVTAWMRHQTTEYDRMKIARVKGERRAVRRQLAGRSVELLKAYRKGQPISPECPLRQALANQ
ncbi:MAG: DUF2293 domain-containing protein [Marinoscillum sp.]|uniref:DUF2293 domain-containing protein n=1 Tax=Marinoscillum sp. TaxID=2024838 RepID=UPI0032F6ADDA